MRHLGSFLLAVALTPIVYLLTGVGLSAFGQAALRGVDERPMASVLAIATLAVAGIVYAILVMARLSPVGPALGGFLFLATSAWPLVDPTSYTNAVDNIGARFKILGVDILGIDLVGKSGIGVLLAIPLIATLTSPRRWSRYADRTAAEVAYYQPPTGYQQTYPYAGAQTRPMDPVTEQLPDVSPPTLFYPRSSSAAAPAPAPVRPTEAAADTVLLLPPPAAAAAAPASAAPAPAPEAAKPVEAAKPAEASKPAAAPKPVEAAKPAEASKPAAAPKPAVASKPAQAPKPPTIPTGATSLIAEPPKAEKVAPKEPDSDMTVRIDPDTLKPI